MSDDENHLIAERRAKLAKLRETGTAFPNDFRRDALAGDLLRGYGENSSFREIAFIVSEARGHWGTAKRVPGISSLSSAGDSGLNRISCRSAGHCTAVGYGENSSHHGIGWAATRT